jgi:hypothetical protein
MATEAGTQYPLLFVVLDGQEGEKVQLPALKLNKSCR